MKHGQKIICIDADKQKVLNLEKYTQLIKLSMLQTTEYLLKSGKGFLFKSQGLK